MNAKKQKLIYKLALKIKDKAPLSDSERRLATDSGIAQLNDTRYGYELTGKGKAEAYLGEG